MPMLNGRDVMSLVSDSQSDDENPEASVKTSSYGDWEVPATLGMIFEHQKIRSALLGLWPEL